MTKRQRRGLTTALLIGFLGFQPALLLAGEHGGQEHGGSPQHEGSHMEGSHMEGSHVGVPEVTTQDLQSLRDASAALEETRPSLARGLHDLYRKLGGQD